MNTPKSTKIQILSVDKERSRELSGRKCFVYKLKNNPGQDEVAYLEGIENEAVKKGILNLTISSQNKTLSFDIPSDKNAQEFLDIVRSYIDQANKKRIDFEAELDTLKL